MLLWCLNQTRWCWRGGSVRCSGVGGVVLLDVVVFAVVGGSWFCLFAVVWFWFFASGFVGVVLVVCGGGF